MDTTLVYLLSILMIVIGILGTVLPVLPGLLLCYGGFLVYVFFTPNDLPSFYLWIFSILTIASLVLGYTLPAQATKKYGGTKWGSIGSVIGSIIGLFIPLPFGFLIGMFGGAFLGELLHNFQDVEKALKATKGAFIGFIVGSGLALVSGFCILGCVILDIMGYL